jgi:photosystem II stability/assembly factor-like uncharacterized protein
MRRALLSATAAAIVLSLTVPAAANGRFPASNQMVFSSNDNNLIVLRTSYGILPSHDNGSTWGYVCEEALDIVGANATQDPSVGLTANNSLIAGVSAGLDVSTDVGCNWNCLGGPLAGQPIADIAVRPDAPASAVAITRTYVATDASAQDVTVSQVYETTDNGVTWTAVGKPIDPTVIVQTIDVAKGAPNRLYVSGTRGFGSVKTASIFVSTDKGSNWTELPLPDADYDQTTEDAIYIGAIDPSDPDRVYIRSSGLEMGGRSRLTVLTGASTATPTFTTARIFDVEAGMQGEITGELLGLALSPDGTKVYVGTKEDGLWIAAASDLKFTKKSSVIVQCLATRGNELWVCSAAKSGFVAGVSTDDGATFTVKLPLIQALTGPIACSAGGPEAGTACNTTQNSSQCGPPYATFCSFYGPCGVSQGGTGDEEGKTPPAASSSSCDISLVGGGGGALFAGAIGVLGIAAGRRRKRR